MGSLYSPRAKANKQVKVLSVPNIVGDASATPLEVGKGNLCRIEGTAGGFVRFAKEGDTTVPSASTKETIKTELGFFFVVATEDFILASATMRCEVTKD